MNEEYELNSIYGASYPGREVVAGDVNSPVGKKKRRFIDTLLEGLASAYSADGQVLNGNGYPVEEGQDPSAATYQALGGIGGTIGKRIAGMFAEGGYVNLPRLDEEDEESGPEESAEGSPDPDAAMEDTEIPVETAEDELTFAPPDPDNTVDLTGDNAIITGEAGPESITLKNNQLVIRPLKFRQFHPQQAPAPQTQRMNEYAGAVDRLANYQPKSPGIARRIAAGLVGAGAGYLASSGTPATQAAGARILPLAMSTADRLLNGRNNRELSQLQREIQARGVAAQIETRANTEAARSTRDYNSAFGKQVQLENDAIKNQADVETRVFNANTNNMRAQTEARRAAQPKQMVVAPGSSLYTFQNGKRVGVEKVPDRTPKESWVLRQLENNEIVAVNPATQESKPTGLKGRAPSANPYTAANSAQTLETKKTQSEVNNLAGRIILEVTEGGKVKREKIPQALQSIQDPNIRGLVNTEIFRIIGKPPKGDDALEFIRERMGGDISDSPAAAQPPVQPPAPATPKAQPKAPSASSPKEFNYGTTKIKLN